MLAICIQCNKQFSRAPSQLKRSDKHFCNSSCSAIYNNQLRKTQCCKLHIKKDYGKCVNCDKPRIRSQSKYCSIQCQQTYHNNYRIQSGKYSAKTAKKYLLKQTNNQCSICGIIDWQDKPLIKILDHIDGNADNNQLSNLRLVCSNCDSQLPTYKSKNKGNGRAFRRQRYKEGKSY